MKADGLYYKHCCPTCGQTIYEFPPMRLCPGCNSPEVVVEFDEAKRSAELGERKQNQRPSGARGRPVPARKTPGKQRGRRKPK